MHPSEPAAAVPVALSPGKRRVAIGVSAAAVLLASIDTYVVVALIKAIVEDLRFTLDDFQRAAPIITWFLLGYVAGMPLLGGISDRFGRRAVIQVCLAGFLVGSAITAGAIEITQWLGTGIELIEFESSTAQNEFALTVLIAGRAIQGFAGGALLPVTMALVADLWAEAKRPAVLGTVGAAQELGSVLGPLYGLWLAALVGWQGVFWINVPLTILAGIAVHFVVPGRKQQATATPRAVDWVGGILLAVSLAMLTLGLDNQNPEQSALPPNGPLYITIGAGVLVLFFLWEWRSKTKLIDLSGSRKGPFFAVLGASFVAGTALLVTLFDVSLLVYGVVAEPGVQVTEQDAAAVLIKFLIALPIGAVLGGFLALRVSIRAVTIAGFLIAAVAYGLVSTWPATILAERYHLGPLSLPRLDTDLAIAGLGLGLVIAPLSAAVLRMVPAQEHGVASAGVVVARTMGMLIGFAALTGWGLHRFNVLATEWRARFFADNPDATFDDLTIAFQEGSRSILLSQYQEIFRLTAILCVVAAVISIGVITGKRRVASKPEPTEEPALVG